MTFARALVLLTSLALAGCGSSPKTHFFALSAAPEASPKPAPVATPVTVAAVDLPASLDRREMVRATGANTVEISDQDRWAAPLGDMIRRVLSEDLAAHLPKDEVILPDSPAPPNTAQIVLAVTEFGPDSEGKVALDGSWSLLHGGKPVLRREVTLAVDQAESGSRGEAAAMSELLGQLATGIAGTLAQVDAQRAEREGRMR